MNTRTKDSSSWNGSKWLCSAGRAESVLLGAQLQQQALSNLLVAPLVNHNRLGPQLVLHIESFQAQTFGLAQILLSASEGRQAVFENGRPYLP